MILHASIFYTALANSTCRKNYAYVIYVHVCSHIFFCSVEHTSGVVVDVGHGVATCCVVWEGEEWEGGECPGSVSCDPLECTAPAVAKMVHSLLQTSCTAEMRAVLQERVVLIGLFEFLTSLLCGCMALIFTHVTHTPQSVCLSVT